MSEMGFHCKYRGERAQGWHVVDVTDDEDTWVAQLRFHPRLHRWQLFTEPGGNDVDGLKKLSGYDEARIWVDRHFDRNL
jgi:hypothetical protein